MDTERLSGVGSKIWRGGCRLYLTRGKDMAGGDDSTERTYTWQRDGGRMSTRWQRYGGTTRLTPLHVANYLAGGRRLDYTLTRGKDMAGGMTTRLKLSLTRGKDILTRGVAIEDLRRCC